MSNDIKTLADVQPGGRVRLGDQAERARFEAWAHAQSYRGGNIMADRDAVHPDVYADPVAQLTWKSWKAALSAQPSPGGQGDRLRYLTQHELDSIGSQAEGMDGEQWDRWVQAKFAEVNGLATVDSDGFTTLAARQPVCSTCDGTRVDPGGLPVCRDCVDARQPVGEPVAYLDLGAGGYMDVGTDLSDEELAAIPKGRHMLRIIGTYGADGYKPAQAVDLGAVREALQAAEGLATICASVDGYSREEVAASGRAMKRQFADVLAKVDSQAVGNG